MADIQGMRMKVDRFYVETRLRGCNCVGCKHNMARVIEGMRGKHCKFKETTLNENGECIEREIAE